MITDYWSVKMFLLTLLLMAALTEGYRVGLGRADVTGPPVEVAFVSLPFK